MSGSSGPTGMSSPSNRFTGAFDSTTLTVIVCSALALYNALELELLVFTTFQSYSGLYFWSLVLASFGIIPYVLGFMIEYFRLSYMALGIAIDSTGWVLMVTGQSVVLYSRLWLVFGGGHRKLLKAVKWMIIVDAIVFHGTTMIVVYGSHYGTNRQNFGQAYNYVERVQMVGFCIQEFILSGLYIWKSLDIISTSHNKRSHRLMWQLFSINVIIIILDIGLLAIEFKSMHVLQQTVKGVTYSVKLKLELAVLNKLVELSTANSRASALTLSNTNEFLDPTRTVWDITRFTPAFSSSMHTYPKWMSDLERSGLQRLDSTYSPADDSWTRNKRNTTCDDDEVEGVPHSLRLVPTLSDPRLNSREKGSATDLLYADAVRRIAG
ncbi:integral membrane protein [Dendryphion nanum]|uniref:Integral membrane protein n=1 Tax=Dendryphion nanum TaxID=256645 RepID=A0A9P9DVP4_9PLEO|nr:integral membrane protein [Dendryphion nanum]